MIVQDMIDRLIPLSNNGKLRAYKVESDKLYYNKLKALIGIYECPLGFVFSYKGTRAFFSFIHLKYNTEWFVVRIFKNIEAYKIIKEHGKILDKALFEEFGTKCMVEAI